MSKRVKKKLHQIIAIVAISCLGISCIGYLFWQSFAYATTQKTNNIHTSAPKINISEFTQTQISQKVKNRINNIQDDYAYNYDLENDASFQKFVNKNHPLNDPWFVPPDLVPVDQKYIVSKVLYPQLRAASAQAFTEMSADFYKEFNAKICLRSAYRSYGEQAAMIHNGCSLNICALPAASEHNLGTAVDITPTDAEGNCIRLNKWSKYYKRLDQNAHTYGFNNSFKRGSHESGIRQEARHRDYNGPHFATFLHKTDLTINEYYTIINSQ